MAHPVLLLLGALRALVEVSLLFLLGQGFLALLAGNRRHANAVYQLFVIVTRPVLRIMRKISPSWIIDGHLPLAAVFFLFWLWIGLAYLRERYCVANLLQCF